MAGLRKLTIIGNVGQDPELKLSQNGNPYLTLSVGTKNHGESDTLWIKCVLFGKLAETMEAFIKKGTQVFIEGKMTLDNWKDKEGSYRTTIQVTVSEIQLLSSRKDDNPTSKAQTKNNPQRVEQTDAGTFDDEKEIPF